MPPKLWRWLERAKVRATEFRGALSAPLSRRLALRMLGALGRLSRPGCGGAGR